MKYSLDCNICPYSQDPESSESELRIIEGDHWIATTRINDQEYLGTAFVTLKDHKESLADLTHDEDDEFIVIRNNLIIAQRRAFGAEAVNLSCLMNNTFADALPAPHVHYHLKPRYSAPVLLAGEVFEDQQFGQYINRKQPHPVSATMGRLITDRIKAELPTLT